MRNLLQDIELSTELKVIQRNLYFVVPTFFIMSILYLWSNHMPHMGATQNGVALDQLIPFMSWTISIYWLVLLVAFTGALMLRDIRHVYILLMVNAIAFMLNFLIWVIYPVIYPDVGYRAEYSVDQLQAGITQGLFSILFYFDSPANSFPSGHVSLMCLLGWVGYSLKGYKGHFILLISVLGVLSVFTTRQHTIIDALGGAFTVLMAVAISRFFIKSTW